MNVGKPAVNGIRQVYRINPFCTAAAALDMTRYISRRAARTALWVAFAAGILTGCAETVHTRGNLPDPTVVAQIAPGKQTREQITQMLGTPSTVATFEQETWFYIGGRVKTKAFFNPEVLERKILAIRFDKSGKVAEINSIDATKIEKVELVARETPTKGRELTFLQQIIGNIGRFGNSAKDEGIF